MSRRILRVLAALLVVALMPGRAFALTPSKMPSQYVLDSWQLDKGLPQNSPLSLAQTRDGYLWVGTQEGLARFDGVRFVVFDRRSTPQFGSNLITALLADSHDRLWIGTSAGPTVLEAGNSNRSASIPRSRPLRSTTSSRTSAAMFGSRPSKACFATTTARIEQVNLDSRGPTGRIRALLEDRSGTLWVATALQGILRLDNHQSSYAPLPAENSASIDASGVA